MLRFIPAVVLFALATIPFANAADPKPTVNDLAWMAGNWIQKTKSAEVEENWTTPKGGILLGVNRSIIIGRTHFEFLRIADTEAGVIYFASPSGQPATEFPLKSREKDKVVFENLKHDFPQTITYWKADGQLHAKIEATVDGKTKAMEWTWDAVK